MLHHVAIPLCTTLMQSGVRLRDDCFIPKADFSPSEWLGFPLSAIPEKAGGISVSTTTKTE
jgi:hypothetical protein